jgi:hypothetical protein
MKRIFLILLLTTINGIPFAEARTLHIGSDILIPYCNDTSSSRAGMLGGAHGELFLVHCMDTSVINTF